ncbi:hypothetical protein BGW42_007206 [Actinomortierella wolfii]|nr:hypothetical protein BGW42_007206 [Actinomortierella wolfii]
MEFELDILGQQPLLNLYTQITLAYPVGHESSHITIVATLQDGLERLHKSFPWVSGQVIQETATDSRPGLFKIVPFPDNAPLVVKDLCHDPAIPTFASLREANFPYSEAILDESYLAPRRTLPGDPSEPTSRPTLLVQATFIRGGLLLTFVAHHMVMDMIGQGEVMRLLSKACHSEAFTEEELAIGNMPRDNIIPYLETMDKSMFAHQVAKPTIPTSGSDEQTPPPPPVKSTWVYFSFNAASLAALKADASASVPSGFISTDDALSALIWQSTTRARLPRLNTTNNRTTFSRAVDVRPYLGLAPTYAGVMQNMTYTSDTIQEVVNLPLGVLASRLRAALDGKHLEYMTRGLATLLRDTADKTTISLTATIDVFKDIMFSSWAKVECHKLEFNLGLGRPVAVRRPKLAPFESLMYLMPRTAQGEIAAAICLRDEDMERLKADPMFLKYAHYIG